MEKEIFWGLGRSWTFGILALVAVTVILAIGNVTPQFWLDTVKWIGGICVGKSTIVGAAKVITNKKQEV